MLSEEERNKIFCIPLIQQDFKNIAERMEEVMGKRQPGERGAYEMSNISKWQEKHPNENRYDP